MMTAGSANLKQTDSLTPQLMCGPSSLWMQPVRHLLDEQSELCIAFERLSSRQTSLIHTGQIDELLSILQERQGLLDRIVGIHRMLEPFHEVRDEAMGGLSNADRVSLQGRIDAVAAAVDRIRRQDDADRRELERQRQRVADELAGVSRLRGAAAAYAGSAARAHGGSLT